MHPNDLKFYEDDEGIAVDLILNSFGRDEVQCVNLEAKLLDKKMKNEISYLILNQVCFLRKIQEGINQYCINTYHHELPDLKLIKIYVFPDKTNEYGFMFSTTIDREHGIGVRMKDENIDKIGSSDVAFV